MAGLAIKAVEFEVFVELGKADKAFKRGLAHLGDALELHVVGDESFDLVGVVIGETEAAAKGVSHANANVDMAVEADAVAGFGGRSEGGRFPDIVQEDSPSQRRRDSGGEAFEHKES